MNPYQSPSLKNDPYDESFGEVILGAIVVFLEVLRIIILWPWWCGLEIDYRLGHWLKSQPLTLTRTILGLMCSMLQGAAVVAGFYMSVFCVLLYSVVISTAIGFVLIVVAPLQLFLQWR